MRLTSKSAPGCTCIYSTCIIFIGIYILDTVKISPRLDSSVCSRVGGGRWKGKERVRVRLSAYLIFLLQHPQIHSDKVNHCVVN